MQAAIANEQTAGPPIDLDRLLAREKELAGEIDRLMAERREHDKMDSVVAVLDDVDSGAEVERLTRALGQKRRQRDVLLAAIRARHTSIDIARVLEERKAREAARPQHLRVLKKYLAAVKKVAEVDAELAASEREFGFQPVRFPGVRLDGFEGKERTFQHVCQTFGYPIQKEASA